MNTSLQLLICCIEVKLFLNAFSRYLAHANTLVCFNNLLNIGYETCIAN